MAKTLFKVLPSVTPYSFSSMCLDSWEVSFCILGTYGGITWRTTWNFASTLSYEFGYFPERATWFSLQPLGGQLWRPENTFWAQESQQAWTLKGATKCDNQGALCGLASLELLISFFSELSFERAPRVELNQRATHKPEGLMSWLRTWGPLGMPPRPSERA